MVYVFFVHSAHYDFSLDTPTENNAIVKTGKEINILLDKREDLLDGVWIQYFFVPKEEFVITNPSKRSHVHHH